MIPLLYIIMRNDLASMNSGKAIAQGSHAANAFVHQFHRWSQEQNSQGKSEQLESLTKAFYDWENSTQQGFGTVLVLEGKMQNIEHTVNLFKAENYISSLVFDPTYPIVDGEVVHHIPLHTCAYIFVPQGKNDLYAMSLLSQYNLHR
jgi:peptidyl-tRNA hydrolase